MNEPLNKRVFVVRNGAGAFKTASGWGALREAKVWYRRQDANMSKRVNTRTNDIAEVVELQAVELAPTDHVLVALPLGHDVLADFLENIGMLDQAMHLRGAKS